MTTTRPLVPREEYTAALRTALVEHVVRTAPATRRRRVLRRLSVGTGALVVLGGAGAAAAHLDLLPGTERVDRLAEPVVVTATGDHVIELGPVPAGATHVDVEVRCHDDGTFWFPGGAGGTCTDGEVTGYAVPADRSIAITTSPGLRWTGVATYTRHEPTDVAVNGNGDTYGSAGSGAAPDLVAAEATNGREGYVYARDLAGYTPTSPADAARWQEEHGHATRVVPVYLSDGETVVGQFEIGPGEGGGVVTP